MNIASRFRNPDLVIASFLLLLTLFTRIPFANKMLHQGDSARFALALKQYDVSQMQPHAPGYILYVAAAELLNLFVHDEQSSLVLVSIITSALMVFVFYYLARKVFDRTNGFVSSLLLIGSPLFWYNGEMPLTYALEGLFCVIFAFCCYKLIQGEWKWLFVSAVVLGLLTGVRQNLIVIFLPLWIYAIRKYSIKRLFVSFFILGITCFVWFLPMVALSGGLSKYLAAVNAQFTTWVTHSISYLYQIKVRGSIFSTFMLYSLGLGILPIFYYFGRFFRIQSIVKDIKTQFLFWWFVPPMFFFIGVNVFNPGHVLVILPPLFIFLAESVKGLSEDLTEGAQILSKYQKSVVIGFINKVFSFKAILVFLVLLLLLVNVHVFLFQKTEISYPVIKERDSHLAELVKLTKENAVPKKSMILTFLYNTQAAFYFPDYLVYCPFPLMYSTSEVPIEAQNVYISFNHQTNPKTYWIPTGFQIKPIPIPDGIDTLIVWEEDVAQYYHDSERALNVIASDLNDTKIYSLKLEHQGSILYDYHYWKVK